MKSFLMMSVIFFSTFAQASADHCLIEITKVHNQHEVIKAPLTAVVREGLDLASYEYTGYVEDFYIHVVQVDGWYIANLKSPTETQSEGPMETVDLQGTYGSTTVKLICE